MQASNKTRNKTEEGKSDENNLGDRKFLTSQLYDEFCKYMETETRSGRNVKDHALELKNKVFCFCQDQGQIPDRVIVNGRCNGMCHRKTDAPRWALFRQIRSALPDLIRSLGGKDACRQLQILLSFGLDDGMEKRYIFVNDVYGNGVDGIVAAGLRYTNKLRFI